MRVRELGVWVAAGETGGCCLAGWLGVWVAAHPGGGSHLRRWLLIPGLT